MPLWHKRKFFLIEAWLIYNRASLVAQTVKRVPTMQETRVQSLGREDLLEKDLATHSCILAWKIPWKEEPGRLCAKSRTRLSDFTFFLIYNVELVSAIQTSDSVIYKIPSAYTSSSFKSIYLFICLCQVLVVTWGISIVCIQDPCNEWTLVVSHGLWNSRASVVGASRLSYFTSRGISVPRPWIELISPALEGGFLTTKPPGKSLFCFLFAFSSK